MTLATLILAPVLASTAMPATSQRPRQAPPKAPQRATAPPAPQQAPAAGSDLVERAEKAIDARDYATAMELLRQRVAVEPRDERALFDIAYIHTIRGEKPQAVAAYRAVLAVQPQMAQAAMNLGLLLVDAGENAEAAKHFATVVAARPKDARAQLLLADALAAAGESRAGGEYGKALALDPKSWEAHAGLARIHIRNKQYPEAERALAAAIELRPGETSLRLEQAALHEAAGREEEASRIYAEVAQREPANAMARRRLGRLLLARRKFAEAAAEFEAAARLSPEPGDQWELARAYAGAKDAARALPFLTKAVAADPRRFEARLMLGEVLAAQRSFPAAQRELEAAVSLRPDLPDAWVTLANVLYQQENYPATLSVLDRVARIAKPTPWLHFLRAISLDKLDQVEPALTSYESFLSAAGGQYPDQEFQARQRARILANRLEKSGKGGKRRKP